MRSRRLLQNEEKNDAPDECEDECDLEGHGGLVEDFVGHDHEVVGLALSVGNVDHSHQATPSVSCRSLDEVV